jgi:RNA polymerase sigma-70 factor (ECF subfamily)
MDLARAESMAPGRKASAPRPTDAALVIEAQRGESWAMEALFRRHLRRVNAVVGRDDDRDDVVQECFVEAVQSLRSLRSPWAFGPWLSAIATRTSWRMFRRRRKQKHARVINRELAERELLNVQASTASPEVSADLRAIHGVLETLHDESRVALLLRRVEGLRLDEIAERMHLSVSTVKRRLCAAQLVLDAVDRDATASK